MERPRVVHLAKLGSSRLIYPYSSTNNYSGVYGLPMAPLAASEPDISSSGTSSPRDESASNVMASSTPTSTGQHTPSTSTPGRVTLLREPSRLSTAGSGQGYPTARSGDNGPRPNTTTASIESRSGGLAARSKPDGRTSQARQPRPRPAMNGDGGRVNARTLNNSFTGETSHRPVNEDTKKYSDNLRICSPLESGATTIPRYSGDRRHLNSSRSSLINNDGRSPQTSSLRQPGFNSRPTPASKVAGSSRNSTHTYSASLSSAPSPSQSIVAKSNSPNCTTVTSTTTTATYPTTSRGESYQRQSRLTQGSSLPRANTKRSPSNKLGPRSLESLASAEDHLPVQSSPQQIRKILQSSPSIAQIHSAGNRKQTEPHKLKRYDNTKTLNNTGRHNPSPESNNIPAENKGPISHYVHTRSETNLLDGTPVCIASSISVRHTAGNSVYSDQRHVRSAESISSLDVSQNTTSHQSYSTNCVTTSRNRPVRPVSNSKLARPSVVTTKTTAPHTNLPNSSQPDSRSIPTKNGNSPRKSSTTSTPANRQSESSTRIPNQPRVRGNDMNTPGTVSKTHAPKISRNSSLEQTNIRHGNDQTRSSDVTTRPPVVSASHLKPEIKDQRHRQGFGFGYTCTANASIKRTPHNASNLNESVEQRTQTHVRDQIRSPCSETRNAKPTPVGFNKSAYKSGEQPCSQDNDYFLSGRKRNSMRMATQGYGSMSDLTKSIDCLILGPDTLSLPVDNNNSVIDDNTFVLPDKTESYNRLTNTYKNKSSAINNTSYTRYQDDINFYPPAVEVFKTSQPEKHISNLSTGPPYTLQSCPSPKTFVNNIQQVQSVTTDSCIPIKHSYFTNSSFILVPGQPDQPEDQANNSNTLKKEDDRPTSCASSCESPSSGYSSSPTSFQGRRNAFNTQTSHHLTTNGQNKKTDDQRNSDNNDLFCSSNNYITKDFAHKVPNTHNSQVDYNNYYSQKEHYNKIKRRSYQLATSDSISDLSCYMDDHLTIADSSSVLATGDSDSVSPRFPTPSSEILSSYQPTQGQSSWTPSPGSYRANSSFGSFYSCQSRPSGCNSPSQSVTSYSPQPLSSIRANSPDKRESFYDNCQDSPKQYRKDSHKRFEHCDGSTTTTESDYKTASTTSWASRYDLNPADDRGKAKLLSRHWVRTTPYRHSRFSPESGPSYNQSSKQNSYARTQANRSRQSTPDDEQTSCKVKTKTNKSKSPSPPESRKKRMASPIAWCTSRTNTEANNKIPSSIDKQHIKTNRRSKSPSPAEPRRRSNSSPFPSTHIPPRKSEEIDESQTSSSLGRQNVKNIEINNTRGYKLKNQTQSPDLKYYSSSTSSPIKQQSLTSNINTQRNGDMYNNTSFRNNSPVNRERKEAFDFEIDDADLDSDEEDGRRAYPPRTPPALGRPRRKEYAGFDSQPLPMDSYVSDSSSVYTDNDNTSISSRSSFRAPSRSADLDTYNRRSSVTSSGRDFVSCSAASSGGETGVLTPRRQMSEDTICNDYESYQHLSDEDSTSATDTPQDNCASISKYQENKEDITTPPETELSRSLSVGSKRSSVTSSGTAHLLKQVSRQNPQVPSLRMRNSVSTQSSPLSRNTHGNDGTNNFGALVKSQSCMPGRNVSEVNIDRQRNTSVKSSGDFHKGNLKRDPNQELSHKSQPQSYPRYQVNSQKDAENRSSSGGFPPKRKYWSSRDILDLLITPERSQHGGSPSLTSLERQAQKVCRAILCCSSDRRMPQREFHL